MLSRRPGWYWCLGSCGSCYSRTTGTGLQLPSCSRPSARRTGWTASLPRRLDQVTKLGKVLDPVADRVLLATAVIGILAVGAVPVPIAVIAMAREGLVAAVDGGVGHGRSSAD